jgi:hypothetical protein
VLNLALVFLSANPSANYVFWSKLTVFPNSNCILVFQIDIPYIKLFPYSNTSFPQMFDGSYCRILPAPFVEALEGSDGAFDKNKNKNKNNNNSPTVCRGCPPQ